MHATKKEDIKKAMKEKAEEAKHEKLMSQMRSRDLTIGTKKAHEVGRYEW
jgi:ribosomal protein L19E